VSNSDNRTAARSRGVQPLGRLLPYAWRYRGEVVAALVFLVVAAVVTLALPLAIRRVIDHGFSASDTGFVDSYFVALLAMAVVLAVASAFRYYFVILIGEHIVADLRRDVFAHVARLSPSFHDVNRSGEIVSRLSADTTQIKSGIGPTASLALRNMILCLGAVSMMVVTSPRLSGLVLIAIPVIVFPLIAFGRKVRRRARAAQDTLADATAYAGETIAAARTVQSFNAEQAATDRFSQAVGDAFDASRAAIRTRAILTGIAITLIFGSVVVVLWIGAHGVLAGTLSAGTLGQFLLYSVLAGSSLGQLSEVWGELSLAAGAAERLGELLDTAPEIAPPPRPVSLPEPSRGDVTFDNVSFSYPSRPDLPTLNGLDFHAAPGETVALVGPSGAGKSTVFSLLLRFYDPAAGRIRIDDVDIRDAVPADIRERLAIVPQDVTIFSGTVRENIAFGRPDAGTEEIVAAAKAALAHDFIEALSGGYDTQVGERGVTLSGGQRQRIAIARAILKNAPILLLDEATSALDAESETLVQRALERLMKGRTTLVIAHRLATVLKADRILVMDHGRIVEQGRHADLVRHGGLYARLAALQFDQGSDPLSSLTL